LFSLAQVELDYGYLENRIFLTEVPHGVHCGEISKLGDLLLWTKMGLVNGELSPLPIGGRKLRSNQSMMPYLRP
jgi:hypothetical protein